MPKINSKKENGHLEITMHLSGEGWKNYLTKAEKRALANVEIKGFRKGQVPLNIAKKYVSAASVRQTALDMLIDEKNNELMDFIHKNKISSNPKLEVVKISDDEVEVKITAALSPEVKLAQINKLTSKMMDTHPTAEELKHELDALEALFKTKHKITDSHQPLHKGDTANINFIGRVDGKEFEGGKAENFDLVIGSKSFIDNFEDQMVGMKVGETKIVKVKFPSVYPVKELADKHAEFEVKLNAIMTDKEMSEEEKKAKLKMFGHDSKESMMEMIKTMLHDRKLDAARNKFFDDVVSELEKHPETVVTIAENVLAEEAKTHLNEFKNQVAQQGLVFEEYLKMVNKSAEDLLKGDMKDRAKKRMMQQMMFWKLVEMFNVEATEKDYNKEVERISKMQHIPVEQVKKQIKFEQVKGAIQFNKLIDKLVEFTK